MKLNLPHRKTVVEWTAQSSAPWTDEAFMDAWEKDLYAFLIEWNNSNAHILAYTSGSTGTPKPIELEKQKMLNSANMTIEFFKLKPNQKALLCLSTNFIAGKMMVVRALSCGMELIATPPNGNPLSQLKDKIDFAAMVPLQAKASIDQLIAVDKLIIGGGKVDAQLSQSLQDLPTKVWSTYGMTETVTHVAVKKINGSDRSEKFHGLHNIQFSTDDRDCLTINAPRLSQSIIQTNDIVELHSSNSFTWKGRFDNIINSGGIKINPEEIETILNPLISFPYFVYGLSDPILENRLVLFIELEDKQQQARLRELLNTEMKNHLSKYKIPKQIVFKSQFIRTESNKIIRYKTVDTNLD